MSSNCLLCQSGDEQRELADRIVHILANQGYPETEADIDWLDLKRTMATEFGVEAELTLSTLRRHVYEHLTWVAAG